MKKIVVKKVNRNIVVTAYLKGKEIAQTFAEMCEFYGNSVFIQPMSRHELFFNQSN